MRWTQRILQHSTELCFRKKIPSVMVWICQRVIMAKKAKPSRANPLQRITKQQAEHWNSCSENDVEFLDAYPAQLCDICREGLMCFHHCTLFTLALQTLASGPVPVRSSSTELCLFSEQKQLRNCKVSSISYGQ